MGKERRLLRKRNKNKVRAIRMKRKKETVALLPKLIARYEECRIFRQDGGEFVTGEVRGPVIVGEDNTLLSNNEVAVLVRGPKFTVRRVLCKERFLVETEKSYIKVR